MMDRWERIDEIIGRAEQIALGILLTVMILTAFFQISLRNIFSTGLAWGDDLVRNLVLWTGFIGATVATREGKHIRLDAVSRWVSPRGKMIVEAITDAFSFLVCSALAFASLKFLLNEVRMGSVVFLEVPSWYSIIILPMACGLMVLRFLMHFLKNLMMIYHRS